jgi:F-type H+-transporting ATPase subunit a
MKRSLSFQKLVFLSLFLTLSAGILSTVNAQAVDSVENAVEPVGMNHDAQEIKVSEVILEHVMDAHVWHLTDGLVIPLPVIIYTKENGLAVFSSSHFFEHHEKVDFNGYRLANNHIFLISTGEAVLDLSITKNVLMLFINAALLLFMLIYVARSYTKNKGKAPKGLQSFIEPVVLFVKDEIAKPNIGPKYEKYLPYLLTLFFFILLGNLLGLIPGASNLTGNIAVTLVLALFTFFITLFSGNKNYWKHILWTPGVPLPLRIIILPVELIGIFTKPFSLMIRLFAAVTAGHIVLLSLVCLTFIFHSAWVGVGSSLFVLFISLIELLVAGIQAYVFTLFSALYIGMAVVEDEHH